MRAAHVLTFRPERSSSKTAASRTNQPAKLLLLIHLHQMARFFSRMRSSPQLQLLLPQVSEPQPSQSQFSHSPDWQEPHGQVQSPSPSSTSRRLNFCLSSSLTSMPYSSHKRSSFFHAFFFSSSLTPLS